MRALPIVGLLLAALGAFIVFRGLSYRREESVFRVGALQASVERQRSVPGWVGGIALGAGAALLIVGLARR